MLRTIKKIRRRYTWPERFFFCTAMFIVAIDIVTLAIIGECSFTSVNRNPKVADLRFDTRNATVNDILGGVQLWSTISSDTSSRRGLDFQKTTTTSDRLIEPTAYATASASLKNVKQTMEQLKEKNGNFSIARAFSIHDFIDHGINSFSCHSDTKAVNENLPQSSHTSVCPMNGLLICIGLRSQSKLFSTSAMNLSREYLNLSTSLSMTEIENLYSNWSSVFNNARSSTLAINFSPEVMRLLLKETCKSDLPVRLFGETVESHTNKKVSIALASIVLSSISIIFSWIIFSPQAVTIHLMLLAINLGLACSQLRLEKQYTSKIVHSMASNSGIKSIAIFNGAGNLVTYFIVIMVLQAVSMFTSLVLSIAYCCFDSGRYERFMWKNEKREPQSQGPENTYYSQGDDPVSGRANYGGVSGGGNITNKSFLPTNSKATEAGVFKATDAGVLGSGAESVFPSNNTADGAFPVISAAASIISVPSPSRDEAEVPPPYQR